VRVAKVGDIKLRWSRELPSPPSSVTFIREADGRYYASFVVERPLRALSFTHNEVGVDLGLSHLAALSDGTKVANPRHLRTRQRALARSQRSLARKQVGSKNRAKAVRKVAVQHRKVREARLDGHHKLALRVVRENQAVHLESLAVKNMVRNRHLARAISDAGWGQLSRLIEEKALRHGRQVVKVGRWYPSSQLCSDCGYCSGPKPLDIRSWACATCGAQHDRDVNAARNILAEGRRVAAGLVETENGCGADVRPGLVLAACEEAATHRGAALCVAR